MVEIKLGDYSVNTIAILDIIKKYIINYSYDIIILEMYLFG